jgi:hypothetical protein
MPTLTWTLISSQFSHDSESYNFAANLPARTMCLKIQQLLLVKKSQSLEAKVCSEAKSNSYHLRTLSTRKNSAWKVHLWQSYYRMWLSPRYLNLFVGLETPDPRPHIGHWINKWGLYWSDEKGWTLGSLRGWKTYCYSWIFRKQW